MDIFPQISSYDPTNVIIFEKMCHQNLHSNENAKYIKTGLKQRKILINSTPSQENEYDKTLELL